MNSYKNYIDVLRSILKNFNDNQFDDIIKNILIKIFDVYYLERDIQMYNIDNVFKQGLEPYSSFSPAVFGQTVSRCST